MPGILGRLASWRRGGSSAYSQPSQSEASAAEGGGSSSSSSSYVRHPLERSATEESRSSAPLDLPAHPVAAAAGAPSRGIQSAQQEGRPATGRSSGRSRQFTGAGRSLFRTRSRPSLAHDHRWQQQSYARRSSMRSGGGDSSSGMNSSLSEAASSRFGGGSAAEEDGRRPAYVDRMLAEQLREQSWARPNFYSGNSSLKDSFLEPRESRQGPPMTSSQVPVTDAFGAPISPRTTALLAELESQDNNAMAGQRGGGAAADSLAEALRRDRVEFESSFLEPEDKEVYFTPIIVFVNFVCFMWQMGEAGWEMAPYAQNPFLGPTSAQLLDNGSQLTACLHGPFRQW